MGSSVNGIHTFSVGMVLTYKQFKMIRGRERIADRQGSNDNDYYVIHRHRCNRRRMYLTMRDIFRQSQITLSHCEGTGRKDGGSSWQCAY